jgi:uncharacterized membrane protein YfcA
MTAVALALVAIAALLSGVSKTAIGGIGLVTAAMMAEVLPAKESTAALLLLLLFGDFYASSVYHKTVEWSALLRLAPSVMIGVVAGWRFLAAASDVQLRDFIGGLVLVLCAIHLIIRNRPKPDHLPHLVTFAAGALAGFTSMAANAAGSIMAIYLLNMHIDRRRYLGTTAWFFFALNLTKLPFSVQLGLFDSGSILQILWALPLVWLGAWAGKKWALRASDRLFENLVLGSAIVGGLNLLLR